MTKLEKLYSIIENSREVGVKLSKDVLQQVEELEEGIIKEEILPALGNDIAPRLEPIKRDLVLVVEYHPGEPISVALSRKTKISEIMGAKTLTPRSSTPVKSEERPAPIEEHEPTKHVENFTKGLRVTFPDGTVIWHQQAVDTLIDTLKKIGLERIPVIGIKHGKGYNLVGKDKRQPEPGRIWQHEADGWYIYTNISNAQKIDALRKISDYYHLDLFIEEGKPNSPQSVAPVGKKKATSRRGRPIKNPYSGKNADKVKNFEEYILQNHDASTARYYPRVLDLHVRDWINNLVDKDADSIFGYKTAEEVRLCIDILKEDDEFMRLNKQKHNAYSAALNKYLLFIEDGERRKKE